MMRKLLIVLLLLFPSVYTMGQKYLQEEIEERFDKLNYVKYITSEAIMGNWSMTSWETNYSCWGDNCNKIKYGLINSAGDSIPPFFNKIEVLQDSLLFFETDAWATLTNEDLKIISPFKNIFPLGNGDYAVKGDVLWGIVDHDMHEKVTLKYDSVQPIKGYLIVDDEDPLLEREAIFMPAQYNGKWGLVELEKDSAVIPFEFEYLKFYKKGIYVIKDGKHGLLTMGNNVLIPIEYDSIATGMVRKGMLWSLNQEPFEFKYSAFTTPVMYNCRCLKSAEGWIMVDGDGKQITNNVYEDIINYRVDIIPLKLKGKWGFIDCHKKKAITPFIYDAVEKHFGYSAEVIFKGEIRTINFEDN